MKIRKAILTGGGRATRLRPITSTTNKHLLPLANKPMIFHAIEKVVEAGITEIFINVNPGDTELPQFVGDGGHWGVSIKFFEQTGGPQGIAHVVNEAKHFIGDDPFIFYLSDNIFLGSLADMVEEFHAREYDCMLALAEVPDPERFGVPIFNAAGELIDTVEKPSQPPNKFAIIGTYIYGPRLFFEAFSNIQKSARGEYEIPSIHSHLLKQGKRVGFTHVTGWWKDTGKPDDLLAANQLLLDHMNTEQFPNHGNVEPGTAITGNVHIGHGTRVGHGVTLTGPVMIAENCVLEDCQIGPHVTVGPGTEICGAHIKNSIILGGCTIRGKRILVDSLIGRGVQLLEISETPGEHRMIVGDQTVLHW